MVDCRGLGITRACADDIGMVLKKLDTLKRVHGVFKLAEWIGGLTLKPSKCVIVPIGETFSEELTSRIKKWISENIPDWTDFDIRPMAKYLGAVLGPAATPEINFALPLAKWRGRAKEISASSSSALVSASEYNSRAASVMSYPCQLFDLPEKVNG